MNNLCTPAIIYLIFSITQILIDLFKGLYNTAFIKGIVTIMVTLLLNILCQRNMSVISWVIVFIPFIFMTVVVSLLLYAFGLDVTTGKIKNISCKDIKLNNNVKYDQNGNILIYDPEYNPKLHPVYFSHPNIIIPNPTLNDVKQNNSITNTPLLSSSPAYKS